MAYHDPNFVWVMDELKLLDRITEHPNEEEKMELLGLMSFLVYLKPKLAGIQVEGDKLVLMTEYPAYRQVVSVLKNFMSGKGARRLINTYTAQQEIELTAYGLRWKFKPETFEALFNTYKSLELKNRWQLKEIGQEYLRQKGE